MKSELEDFLANLGRPKKTARFAVLRFALMVEYYPTEEDALGRISKLGNLERVAIVDRLTGITRCLRPHFQLVMARLRRDGTAPRNFKRAGSIGHVLRKNPW